MTLSPSSDLMQVSVKGFKLFNDRHGKPRCYHRATGIAVDLNKFPLGSVEFLGECGRISALSAPEAKAKPGSLGMLIKEFRASAQWNDLAPATRSWYERGFIYLKPINDTPLVRFSAPLIVKIRDKAQKKKGWYFANLVRTSLSTVFAWGVERGYVQMNYAEQVGKLKRPKDLARANRPWTAEEREIALNGTSAHIKPVLAAMLYTGIDPCDAIKLAKTKYQDGVFDLSRQKTGNPVWKPAPKILKKMIEEMPPHNAITLFANSYGKPWTTSGFNSVWLKERDKIGLPKGLTLKGLRHTHATMLREQGEDDRTIADALGDKSESMGRWYSRDADIKDKMKRVVKLFDKTHKIVKPKKKSVKP